MTSSRSLVQNGKEWDINLWVVTVDFQKAFDSVSHDSKLGNRSKNSVNEACVKLLVNMYDEQTGGGS